MELVLKGKSKSQRLLKPTLKDLVLVENLHVRKIKKKDIIHFRGGIVSKPWGAEYLCGQNKNVEVWELHIDPQAATSMHCHPNKDTLNIVLEGEVILETIGKKEVLRYGDFKLLKAGVIHKTRNDSSESHVRILEIESPPNKYDLIRVKDDYGRESLGYVKHRTRESVKGFTKRLCLMSGPRVNRQKSYVLCGFMPRKRNARNSISMHELTLNNMSFQDPKRELLDRLMSLKYTNLLVSEGSLSLHKNGTVLKLLPGDCVAGVRLNGFNWSAKMAKTFIW
ncbi:MAG: cupin domain-containing protein [Candidatus Uhrbacteria bacterium]|nr:cupin domain-containing protein [Candidatus Uhrbacteria bacterium]